MQHIIKSHKNRNLKGLRVYLLLIILVVSKAVSMAIENRAEGAARIQTGIAEKIIRFHVIANSDSEEDQTLKYKVKDALVSSLSPKLKSAKNIEEARRIVADKLVSIQDEAQEIVHKNGYNYSVTVTLEPNYFPLKVYGSYTFPPGIYEALRVIIGEAEGQNWWCVMFPPLCFIDETYSVVGADSNTQLKHLLTEEEYDSLRAKRTRIIYRFKLWDSFKRLFC